MEAVVVLLNSALGTYIPQNFVEGFDLDEWSISLSEEDKEIMQDPSNDWYWDVWEEILNNAKYTTADGDVYTLYQDDDLFAVCFEKMTEEQKKTFGFED
jgi:hypothetical protein